MIIHQLQIRELLDEFEIVAAEAQNLAFLCRDIHLQRRELIKLDQFIERASSIKNTAPEKYTEEELNLVLYLITVIEAVRSEIEMLIAFKDDRMDGAWAYLVNAQTKLSVAISNHPINADQLQGYGQRLNAYEHLLFPKMMFASVGGIIRQTRCSICGSEYEDCDHIKGKFYNGELCVREIHEMELEEVSLVENPANKMCRVLSTRYNNKEVDALTLREKIK